MRLYAGIIQLSVRFQTGYPIVPPLGVSQYMQGQCHRRQHTSNSLDEGVLTVVYSIIGSNVTSFGGEVCKQEPSLYQRSCREVLFPDGSAVPNCIFQQWGDLTLCLSRLKRPLVRTLFPLFFPFPTSPVSGGREAISVHRKGDTSVYRRHHLNVFQVLTPYSTVPSN